MAATAEKTNKHDARDLYYARRRSIAYLGELAIKQEDLGLNDPITHLDRYARGGEDMLPGIREDLDALILEMLPDPFENVVNFEYQDGDFVSVKDRVKIKAITAFNQKVLETEVKNNPDNHDLSAEMFRAKAEAREPYLVEEWFNHAQAGDVMIAESPPIGSQEYALVRLHFKTGGTTMQEYVVALHNPSIDNFNRLNRRLGLPAGDAKTPIELLATPYSLKLQPSKKPKDFVDRYVNEYDAILAGDDPTGQSYTYGVAGLNKSKIETNRQRVLKDSPIKQIYTSALSAFSKSGGYADTQVMDIVDSLRLDHRFHLGERLTVDNVRSTLRDILQAIASTYDQAETRTIDELSVSSADPGAVYKAVGEYGSQARAENRVYDSACPTIDRTVASNEKAIIGRGYNIRLINGEMLEDFGEPRQGICRTKSCLSRGFGKRPNRTLVGGCDFCVECHKMLQQKKNPQTEHAKKRREVEAKITLSKFRRVA